MLLLLACGVPERTCPADTIEVDGVCYRDDGDTPNEDDTGTPPELPSCSGDLWDARGGPLYFACLASTETSSTWLLGDLDGFGRLEIELYGEDGYVEFHDAFVAGDGAWSLTLSRVADPADHVSNATTLFGAGDAYTFEAVAFDPEGALADCAGTAGTDCRAAVGG